MLQKKTKTRDSRWREVDEQKPKQQTSDDHQKFQCWIRTLQKTRVHLLPFWILWTVAMDKVDLYTVNIGRDLQIKEFFQMADQMTLFLLGKYTPRLKENLVLNCTH